MRAEERTRKRRDKGEERERCATQEVDGGKISFAPVVTDQKNRRGKKRDETKRRGGLVPLEGCYVCARMGALPGRGILEYEEFWEFSGD